MLLDTLEIESSRMEKRRYSTPYIISGHISTKPSRRTFEIEETEIDTSTDTDHSVTNNLQMIGKSKSLIDTSSKVNLSRNYFSTDYIDNLSSSSKTQKKPMLIRAEAIDLPGISPDSNIVTANSDICGINETNSRMKHDVRPHLLVSFFVKHFEKMQKKMTKRPLGSSLSFDLDEHRRMQVLQHGHDSQDKSILSLPVNIRYSNSSHTGLNCFHCLIDASLRERKLRLENGIRLWSSSDRPSIHLTDSKQYISSKVSLHDSVRVINK